MSFYNKYVVPRLITCACGTKPILRQRQKVVPLARGTVLEIGLGAGQNLPHYNAEQIDKVIGVDPCEVSWQLAQERVRAAAFPVEFMAASAESIPLGDGRVDSVLLTFALCTIPNPDVALLEMRRVLKPGGELIFCEHGQAPDANVARWQARVNPFWRRLAGGCNLNRDVPQLLSDAGFDTDSISQMYLPNTPKIAGYNVWGVARAR